MMRQLIAMILALFLSPASAGERPIYIAVGDYARPPIGWVQFCRDNHPECVAGVAEPRDAVLTPEAWNQLVEINGYVNSTIEQISDIDHWGVIEKWSYPFDGQGDCEDFVLLKRRLLMDAGWSRSALLITVVRDQHNEGHAVLTVRTDRGEFILDNQVEDILPWYETGYRFMKRQSQFDPNLWVTLGDNRPNLTSSMGK